MLRLHEFVYHRPDTLGHAVALLGEHAGDVMPIAGGTDLVPNMKHGLFTPAHVVALRQIDELRGIGQREGELWIGPAETLAAVSRDSRVQRWFPSLAKAAGNVAGPQLRNMGTIGGNLCLDTRCNYLDQNEEWRRAIHDCLKCGGDTCWTAPGGDDCWAVNSSDSVPVMMVLGARVRLLGADGEREIPCDELYAVDD
ncbi:MAG: FAD binding domain-containing protein, partial [Longimicrobiales bacterium]